MAQNDIVARYVLKFSDLASKGLLGVAGNARIAALGLAGIAAAAGTAAIAAGGFVLNAAQKYSEFVDSLDEASVKMGVNINYLKDLRSAMGKAGVESGQVDAGLTKFAVTLGKLKLGGKALANVPSALQNQLKGAKDATEANRIALAELAKIPDATERAAVAAALYGKSAGPAFAGAVADVDALNAAFKRSRELTGVITPDAVKAASEYQDKLADMNQGLFALQATVGAAAIPALTKMIDKFTGFMVQNKAAISSGLTVFFDKLAAVVSEVDWEAVGNGFIGLVETLPVIIPLLAEIAQWLPEILIGMLAINAVRFGSALITGLGGASKALSMFAGSGLAGKLVNNVMKIGPAFASIGPFIAKIGPWFARVGVWLSGIPGMIARFVPWIMRGASIFLRFLGPIGLAISAGVLIYQNWERIKSGALQLLNAVRSAWSGIVSSVSGAVSSAIAIGQRLVGFFAGLPSRLAQVGIQLMQGLINGIASGAAAVYAKVLEVAGNVKNKFKEFFGIASPSRLFADFGGYLSQGLAGGISSSASLAYAAASKLAQGVESQMTGLGGNQSFGFNSDGLANANSQAVSARASIAPFVFEHRHNWSGLPYGTNVETGSVRVSPATARNAPRRSGVVT